MNSPENKFISKLPFTAEAIFVSLLEAGHVAEDIKTIYKGGSKKSYSDDVEDIKIIDKGNRQKIEMHINRDGFYDQLPEGLFHQTKGSSRVTEVSDVVDEHKQFKEEEKQARKFFSPLEQMLFLYSVESEKAERASIYNIQNGALTHAFYDFWNISTNLPAKPANRLLQLMPYVDFIKGNLNNTTQALEYILNTKVYIETKQYSIPEIFKQPKLTDMQLAINTVLGSTNGEYINCWYCEIMEVSNEDLPAYANGNPMKLLLERFTEIFIPMDIDIEYSFFPAHQSQKEIYENILGIGAYL